MVALGSHFPQVAVVVPLADSISIIILDRALTAHSLPQVAAALQVPWLSEMRAQIVMVAVSARLLLHLVQVVRQHPLAARAAAELALRLAAAAEPVPAEQPVAAAVVAARVLAPPKLYRLL